MTSSVKPEIRSVSLRRQRRTEPQSCRVCPNVQFYTKCSVPVLMFSSNLCSSNCTYVQLQFTAMQCYAPNPTGGANSAPQTSLLNFGEMKRRRKEREKGKGKKKKIFSILVVISLVGTISGKSLKSLPPDVIF